MLLKLDSGLAHLCVGLLVVHLAVGLLHIPRPVAVASLRKDHVCLCGVLARVVVLS